MLAQRLGFSTHMFSMYETRLKMHKNLVTCVIFGQTSPVIVRNEKTSVQGHIVAIRPERDHELIVQTNGADIVYLDGVYFTPNLADFACLDRKWADIPHKIRKQNGPALEDFRKFLGGDNFSHSLQMAEVINHLYTEPFYRMSQDELAIRLGLERTLALRFFKSVTGLTFRKFKKWCALIAATHIAKEGEKITLAAIETGFSDVSHISRTAVEVFGLTPTIALNALDSFISLENIKST